MTEHARKYKGAPSMEVLRERFESHNFEPSTDSVEYLKDRFIRHTKRRFAVRSLIDLSQQLDNPKVIDNIDGLLLGEARRLAQLMPTTQVKKFSDIEDRIETYETGNHENRGIKMGIPSIDERTMGMQPHEMITIAGWQGTGKSTLVQWILFNAWMAGETPMIISLEMEASALLRKWDTMLTNFKYRDLKAHDLSPEDIERWKIKAQMVKDKKCDIIIKDDVKDCTADFVYAEAMRYQPSLLAIDYISLMETSRSAGQAMWEKVTHITNQLKQVARTTGIPIIAVAQTNIASADGGAELSNISYSRSIGQDSDIVLGLHQDADMKENKQMTVRMLKNRDGDGVNTDLKWDMEHMKFSDWSEVEAIKAVKERRENINYDTGEIT